MSRRKKRGGADNLGRDPHGWLVTYSDMITLCLTFFVLLFSFSVLDQQKFSELITSIQGSLGVLPGGPSINAAYPPNQTVLESEDMEDNRIGQTGREIEKINEFLQYQQEMRRLEDIQTELADYLEEKGLSYSISLVQEERGLVISFQDSVLFNKGKADILPESREILQEVGRILQNTENNIRIEGHTDNVPQYSYLYPSNWELSTGRATNVLRFLINEGLAPEKLSAVGYGEYHPIATNDTEEGRRLNRRVDIVILRESMQKYEPR